VRMGRNDSGFVGGCQSIENLLCRAQGRPVGLAAHDEADKRGGDGHAPVCSGRAAPKPRSAALYGPGPARKGATGRAALRGSG